MLTREAVNEICALYRCAKDRKEQIQILSQLYLMHPGEIRRVLKDNGYKLPAERDSGVIKRVHDAMAAGGDAYEIASEFGISRATVYSYISKHRQRTNQSVPKGAMVLKVKECARQGMTAEQIAAQLGIHKNTVNYHLKRIREGKV